MCLFARKVEIVDDFFAQIVKHVNVWMSVRVLSSKNIKTLTVCTKYKSSKYVSVFVEKTTIQHRDDIKMIHKNILIYHPSVQGVQTGSGGEIRMRK